MTMNEQEMLDLVQMLIHVSNIEIFHDYMNVYELYFGIDQVENSE